jgi:carbon-monoxide dehydrogenase large subunit
MGARNFGARVKRLEDPRLLAGKGRYVADVNLPGMLEAAFVRSTEAHATIRAIDTSAARSVPGVIAVFTMADFGARFASRPMLHVAPNPAIRQYITQYPLATREVCYVGEAVALVVARDRYIAEDAVQRVVVDYEPLPAIVEIERALTGDAPRAHCDSPDNLIATLAMRFGDAAEAFARAPHVVHERLRQHRGAPHSMECRGVIAQYDGATDQLTLWSATQAPYLVRRYLAQYLQREEALIRVIAPDVGGGFGPKAAHYPEEIVLALAALNLEYPVKWIEDRREHFLCTTQQRDQVWSVEAATDGDGRLLAIRGRVLHENGAYLPYGLVLPFTSLAPLPGPYAIPALDVTMDVVFTNAVPTSPIRGAGRPNAAFALERLMDAVARQLRIDPAEVRRRNFVREAQFPYATGAKNAAGAAVSYDSGDYHACLEDVLARADYANFPSRRQAALGEGRAIGLGIASYNEDTGAPPYEGATVRILPSGRIVVQTGAASQGQGLATILAQVCADAFGVSADAVMVESGDTGKFPLGVGTVASRVAVNAASSVYGAAIQVREKALKLAARMLEASEQDLVIDNGVVHVTGVPAMKVTLGDLARSLAGNVNMVLPAGFSPGLEATVYHEITRTTYAAGSNVTEVEVDLDTGEVRLLNHWVTHDCGRMINPLLVDGQVVGGTVHGFGNALFERMAYATDSGQPLTTNLGEYLLPSSTDVPPIHVAHIETPSPLNPLGIKGAGEGGTIPAIAAVIAAVENALSHLDVRIREYPLDPPRLLALIEAARLGDAR